MDHPQNADLLRPFDLEAAKAGAPVQILGHTPIKMTYVAGPDSCGKYIFTIPDGRFTRPESCEVERLRMVPLAWLEGRPVYKGDRLYSSFFKKMFVVGGVSCTDSDYLTAPEINDRANTNISRCSWEAPKPKTEKVRLLGTITVDGFLRLVKEGSTAHRNAIAGGLLRVPGEDKEVEVVLAIPGTRYMDPPGGGDVSLGEQVRRMALDLGAVTAQRNSLEGALELMLERIPKPPNRNCSCHISPPCNDCVDFGGEREAFEVAKEALASLNGE